MFILATVTCEPNVPVFFNMSELSDCVFVKVKQLIKNIKLRI